VPVGQVGHHLGGQGAEQRLGQPVEAVVVDAVADLEPLEEHQQLFHVLQGEPAVDPEEGVGDRVEDVLVQQVLPEAVEVVPQPLDLGVLLLGDPEHQAVDGAAVFGKPGGHLRGEEHPRQVGDLQGSGHRVVVADGDEIHPACPAGAVDGFGLGEALRGGDLAQHPFVGTVRVLGVDVQVGACGHPVLRRVVAAGVFPLSVPGRPEPTRIDGPQPRAAIRSSGDGPVSRW
jgi:hypothetical protein